MIWREYPVSGVNKRTAGSGYEALAAHYLEEKGYQILERNFRSSSAEIDIVAQEGRYLVFAEVKQRSTCRRGSGRDAVDERKQKRICRAARWYMYRRRLSDETPVRFDVVSIDAGRITLVRNAFSWNL